VQRFSLVLANFPFSDEFWWLQPEQQTDDKKKRAKLKTEVFAKEGYKDPYGRFGRGTPFRAPPAGYGDYAFILHIVASLAERGRAGVVCPQGVLFRGQPEVEEETGEFDADGNPIIRRRKADDEHLIREALLHSGLVDAVISLPLNVFYGAGVPACLLILRKDRPAERRECVLLVYAARHYRELSAQNELRPQDVMRILVHYHAYGDASRVPALVAEHGDRVRQQISAREHDELERIEAEYQPTADKLAAIDTELAALRLRLDPTMPSPGARDVSAAGTAKASEVGRGCRQTVSLSNGQYPTHLASAPAAADRTLPDTAEAAAEPLRTAGSSRDSRCCQSSGARDAQPVPGGFAVSPSASAPPPFSLSSAPPATKAERKAALAEIARLEKQREKPAAKLAERDERLTETRRRAEDDRAAVTTVGQELEALHADPDELLKHARVVALDEIAENEFNLNIPRYVDTFEPEPRIEVPAALKALREAEDALASAERDLKGLLGAAGYEQ
jgi:type I restriction-modification system DNA methylase subunit